MGREKREEEEEEAAVATKQWKSILTLSRGNLDSLLPTQ